MSMVYQPFLAAELAVRMAWQFFSGATTSQVAEQPSPSTLPPSSHCSSGSTRRLPHTPRSRILPPTVTLPSTTRLPLTWIFLLDSVCRLIDQELTLPSVMLGLHRLLALPQK